MAIMTIDAAIPTSKRTEIIGQALEIFHQYGFHATSVDTVLAKINVSKRTLYKYFRSKEELVEQAVRYYQAEAVRVIQEELVKRSQDPTGRLLALFDLRREILEAGDYSGCFALNAQAEYQNRSQLIESACTEFLQGLENIISDLCIQAKYPNPSQLTKRLMILLEGVIVYGAARRDSSVATAAQDIARLLLQQQ